MDTLPVGGVVSGTGMYALCWADRADSLSAVSYALTARSR
jgi:hypothetical protein